MNPSLLRVRTPAKINPVLEVLGKRPDGYHELALVFQAVSLFDELSFRPQKAGISFAVQGSPGPLAADDSNLVVKAAKMFLAEVLQNQAGVEMGLIKKIPLAAGLGGGSSDAAATLLGLNWLFDAQAPAEQLQSMAARLGSDVPFFLTGGTALGTGRGEVITPWPSPLETHLVLVKPAEGLSTPAVYRSGLAVMSDGRRARDFQASLKEKNLPKMIGRLFNGLEPAASALMPEIGVIQNKLVEAGALAVLVSGSGPTVFGVAESRAQAQTMAGKLEGSGWSVFTAQTLSTGVERI